MPTILVVEESLEDRLRIGSLLAPEDYKVVQTARASAALDEAKQHAPDLVILDLQISAAADMLELVSALRQNFPYVPIILVTGGSNPEIAIESLRRGASSYVPRNGMEHELLPTIRNLLSLVAPGRSRSEVADVMLDCGYRFCLPNSYPLIGALVSYLEQVLRDLGTCGGPDCVRVSVALLEALSNALYHGNLELDSRLRERDFDAYRDAAKTRAQTPPYADRKIYAECSISRDKAVFVVRDEGRGFDPASLPALPEGPNLDRVTGRGIMLMRTMMDEVKFNETGNEVTMIKYRPADKDS